MDLAHVLLSHTRINEPLRMSCTCGWSVMGLDSTKFYQHQSDVVSEIVSGWIELFCNEISQSLASYADMLEDDPSQMTEVIESMRQNAENYRERAEEVREDGTF